MTISVPDHKELKKRTLKSILRQVGLTVREFEKLG
jgi:predicted RNA binding protein YcfA (HicA-like mRNA interferase family)